jgi:hypothetical protein
MALGVCGVCRSESAWTAPRASCGWYMNIGTRARVTERRGEAKLHAGRAAAMCAGGAAEARAGGVGSRRREKRTKRRRGQGCGG